MKSLMPFVIAIVLHAQTITVSPSSITVGDTVTVTVTNAPIQFPDSWVALYPQGEVVLSGWLRAPACTIGDCWSWLDNTQADYYNTNTFPPAKSSATLKFTVNAAPGTYQWILHGGNGTYGPFNPVAGLNPMTAALTVNPASSTPTITRQQCIGSGTSTTINPATGKPYAWSCKDVEVWTVTVNGVAKTYTVSPPLATPLPACPAGTTTSATACLITVAIDAPMQ